MTSAYGKGWVGHAHPLCRGWVGDAPPTDVIAFHTCEGGAAVHQSLPHSVLHYSVRKGPDI
jgi:hypothetical protein